MRVALVAPWFHPHVGGVESHVRSLAAEVARRDHEVTVLTSNYAKLAEREEMDGFVVRRLPCLTIAMKTPITPAIRRVVPEGRYDVVHAHSPPPLSAYYAALGCERSRTPFVLTHHCDPEIPTIFGPALVELYRRTYGKETMRRAAKVIVTTGTYAATSRTVWRYNPVVIPNAVDHLRFHPDLDGVPVRSRLGLPEDEPVVLFVGRVMPHKGIEHLVEAAKYVPNARFVIVGDGAFLPTVRRLAATFGVEDRVVFAGRVPYRDLPAFYAACDVFVLPSVSRLEAFGIVALEAMAAGTPVVVTDIPGVREIVTDGAEGLVADPVNPEDLAVKIRTLLEDADLREVAGLRARESVLERFTTERMTDAVEEVYREVARESRRPVRAVEAVAR